MVVVMVMTAMVPVAAPLAATVPTRAIVRGYAPETVTAPSALLTFLGTVLCAAAAAALGKLPGVLLPFAALPVCALADAAAGIVLSAEVAHDYAGPVAHFALLRGDRSCGGVAGGGGGFGGEFLDEREDVVGQLAWLFNKLIIPIFIKLVL